MVRHYISQIVGDGSDDNSFRPALMDIVRASWSGDDGRSDSTLGSGWMFVSADVTDAQHALLQADPRIVVVPTEDAAGAALPVDATVRDIPLAKRQAIQSRLEAQHIPLHDITLDTPIREVLKRIVRRCKLRQVLANLDYFEGLDTLVSDVPTQRRNAIRIRLESFGFDTSVIAGRDTIREALRKLMAQAHLLGTRFD